MRGFFLKISQFIKGVQRSDNRVKKRWLVFFSGIAMILVIALWITYLNITLPQSTGIPTGTSTEILAQPTIQKDDGKTFFKTLGLGWNIVWDDIEQNINGIGNTVGNGWTKFKEQLNRTNEMNLQNPEIVPPPLP